VDRPIRSRSEKPDLWREANAAGCQMSDFEEIVAEYILINGQVVRLPEPDFGDDMPAE
jgi:hypothetical protein